MYAERYERTCQKKHAGKTVAEPNGDQGLNSASRDGSYDLLSSAGTSAADGS